ncbi:unnamed protein product, partial [Ectocarpus fasciculatus]
MVGIMDQAGVWGLWVVSQGHHASRGRLAAVMMARRRLPVLRHQPTLVSRSEPLVALALAPLAMHTNQSVSSLRLGKKKMRRAQEGPCIVRHTIFIGVHRSCR